MSDFDPRATLDDPEERAALRNILSRAESVIVKDAPVPGIPFSESAMPASLFVALLDEWDRAVQRERNRLIDEVGQHISLSTSPVWAHVDSYGLGQLLQGKPWPEGRR